MKLIVMRGLQGSGKSFRARRLQERCQAAGKELIIPSADDYQTENGVYCYKPARASIAHALCFKRAYDAMQDKKLVIVDNTNTHAYEISPYMIAAVSANYQSMLFDVECDPAEAFARQTHDVAWSIFCVARRTLQIEQIPMFWQRESTMSMGENALLEWLLK